MDRVGIGRDDEIELHRAKALIPRPVLGMGDQRPGNALAARIRMGGKAGIGDMGRRARGGCRPTWLVPSTAHRFRHKGGKGRGEPVRQRRIAKYRAGCNGFPRAIDGFRIVQIAG